MEKYFTIYISTSLERKLGHLLSAKVGVIEAPAGYGKTTAMSAALDKVPTANKHCFTAEKTYRPYETGLYNWFVSEVERFDMDTSKKLQAQGHFNRANQYDIRQIIREINVETEHYIIIDNLQYLSDEFSHVLVKALLENQCGKLHLIIVTQYLSPKQKKLLSGTECFSLAASDLLLSKEDVMDYADKMGVHLSPENTALLWQRTEGWIIMVALYLKKIKEENKAPQSADVITLLAELCWKNLDDEEKHILLYFSIWQTITRSSLEYLCIKEHLGLSPNDVHGLMHKIPLIKFDPLADSFTMHNILKEYIEKRFEDATEKEQKQVLQAAGFLEKERGNNCRAVSLFFKNRDYEQLLSCDLTNMLMEDLGGVIFYQVALDVYENCPDQILRRNPISCLKLCYALYGAARFDEYEGFLERLHEIILPLEEDQLLGEWTIVSAFRVFPDISKMTLIYKKASKLMKKKSEIFTYREPYLFGCTSMWYLYYTKVGQAEKLADQMDTMIAVYNSITNGHGAGAEMLYRGEVYCVEGRFEEAEILAHTAARMAEAKKNVSVTFGVALLLGIIAIYRDDTVALEEAIKYLENHATGYTFMENTALNKYMSETVRGYLLGLLMETQSTSDWVHKWDFAGTELSFTNFMVKTAQITDMILHKEYKKAIANVEASLTFDERLISLPTKNFMHVGLALCYLAIGNVKKAAQNLEISLSLAEKDKNFTFLACFRRYLAPLMLLPGVRKNHEEAIAQIKKLKLNYTVVEKKAIFDSLLQENLIPEGLTDRELEIATMAAKGMRNKEIAKKLCISEYTVKNHLATVYQKLSIDRRSKLIDMLK